MNTPTIERRVMASPVEIRTVGEKRFFTGRAVEYNQWSELLYGVFREQIAPGAFDESLSSQRDIYADIDHDPARILGRVSANTLQLTPDARGIGVTVPAGEYSYAKDLATAIGRGDLRGMSFIFDVQDDAWETRDGIPHRTVKRADLYEVAFVFFPAYPETSAGMRLALPVGGEKRALGRVFESLIQPELKKKLMRIRMAEAE